MKKLLNFLLGYVLINIRGEGIERFINFAIQRGIHIWDIYWKEDGTVRAKVQLASVKPLRHVARKSRCRFRIVGRRGCPFTIHYFKKRKMLAVGALMFITILYLLSSFVFFIEVTSQEPVINVTPQLIKRLAAEKGIITGRPKWLMDFKDTEKYLMSKVPQLAWVGISAKGTRVEIEIVEKIVPEPGEKDRTPGSIVALKDGIITEILVMRGQPCVGPGDTVSRGQVMISGLVKEQTGEAPSDAKEEKVKADGIVRARVWYRGYGECPIVENGKKSTGEMTYSVSLKWHEKKVVIWGPKTSPYRLSISDTKIQKFDLGRSIRLPVEIIITTYREQETYEKFWGNDGAWQQAVKIAFAAAKRQIPTQANIVNQEVRPVDGDMAGLKRALVVLETKEDIGKFLPIE